MCWSSKEYMKEYSKVYGKKYYQKNKEKLKAYAKDYYHKKDKGQVREYSKLLREKYRFLALQTIGKGIIICSKCGCKEIRLIEINHINGLIDRQERFRNVSFYKNIAKGIRKIDDLNLLCKVCNWAYSIEKKYGINYKIECINSETKQDIII